MDVATPAQAGCLNQHFVIVKFRNACLRKHDVYENDLRGDIGIVRFKTGTILANFTFVVIHKVRSLKLALERPKFLPPFAV